MLPTLQIGDHLFVSKFIYGIKLPFTGKTVIPLSSPHANDVIVFKYPQDTSLDYIKRVIATPGDTLEIRNKKIYINDAPFDDSHAHFSDPTVLDKLSSPRDNYGPITIPKGKYFVMGDNRDNSYDSRFWGYVDKDQILGEAFIIYWSWDMEKSIFSLDRFSSIRWSRIGDIIH